MSDDYFTKMSKNTQPVRDAFAPKKPPAAPAAPKAPKAPETVAEAGKMYPGQKLSDWHYMDEAQKKISKKLAPKSVMGKSSPKR